MPCRELVELVTDYLEGRLSPADRARFEANIDDCEYCETYLEQIRETIRALRAAAGGVALVRGARGAPGGVSRLVTRLTPDL
jgi:anti-sigma factor RsiW